MILAIVAVTLGMNVVQAHAWDSKKFGPILDGEEQLNRPQFIHI